MNMQIHQIIREKRKALGLTQEQVAERLGVSTPAVNKWEKGSTYPDITLLPALARLLETDLNTLLSFQAELTQQEIDDFVNAVDQVIKEQGYEQGFQMALDKLREYPACEGLLYWVTLYLDGAMLFYGVSEHVPYKAQLQSFYERLAGSAEASVRETAQAMLIANYRQCGELAKAEALIQSLPRAALDQEEQWAVRYTQQGNDEEAKKLWAHRLRSGVMEIQTALLYLLEIALKEGEAADAALYASKYEDLTRAFELPEWMAANAHLQLAVGQEDSKACMALLRQILPAMRENGGISTSPLYRELGDRDNKAFFSVLADALQKELMNSEKWAFLRADEDFAAFRAELAAL